MKLSEYIAARRESTPDEYEVNGVRVVENDGENRLHMVYQTIVGLLDVTFDNGEYIIYHTDAPTLVNGEVAINQVIHYQGTDKKQAINVLMNLYDIQP